MFGERLNEILVAVVATSTHIPSTTVTTTVTTTSSFAVGQGNDTSLGRSTQQSPQQLGTASVQQMQPSMFSQGIHFANALPVNFVIHFDIFNS